MATRKKWRVVYPGAPEVDEFPSEVKAYVWVENLRTAWVAGGPTSALTVQVDEGFGWTPYEHINFAEEATNV
jgi:hypothetical protein